MYFFMLLFGFWIQVAGTGLFMLGFFKMDVGNLFYSDATVDRTPHSNQTAKTNMMSRYVGQVVMVIIDALREDFVLNSTAHSAKIRFLADLHQKASFLARVSAPTVTLPRIKALMTGNLPGFSDYLMNLGKSEIDPENLISVWRRENRKIIFYGDNTWLKLFTPSTTFHRSEGVSSLYVMDYTQVDDNVTRNVADEISAFDWDVGIFHYLGLDHIGHIEGPRSNLIPSKLDEMSTILSGIYHTLVYDKPWKDNLPPLLIVMGDHGMADAGGHGGSSYEEINTPIIVLAPPGFIDQTDEFFVVNQVDIVPTLALLTGVSIPKNSIGVLMERAVPPKVRRHLLRQNLEQLQHLHGSKETTRLPSDDDDIETLRVLLKGTSSELQRLVDTNFDFGKIIFGISLVFMSFVILLAHEVVSFDRTFILILTIGVVPAFTLASTSFIEEEHQTVYFIASTLFATVPLWNFSAYSRNNLIIHVILGLGLLRIMRAWNRTGNKWSYLPAVTDWLYTNPRMTLTLMGISILLVSIHDTIIRQLASKWRKTRQVMTLIAFGSIAWYKFYQVWSTSGNQNRNFELLLLPRLIYLLCLIDVVLAGKLTSKSLLPLWMILLSPLNIPLLAMAVFLETFFICPLVSNHRQIVVSSVYGLFGHVTYFCLGNSNSLSTINFAAGYTGLNTYSPLPVWLLVGFHTYCGLHLWLLSTPDCSSFRTIGWQTGLQISFFLFIVIINRHHLFVQSVFSPKLIYFGIMSFSQACILTTILLVFKLLH